MYRYLYISIAFLCVASPYSGTYAFSYHRNDFIRASEKTPLMTMTEQNQIDQIKKILKNGVNVNQADENGMTPIMVAAHEGNVEIVTMLLSKLANINALDNKELNSLRYAIALSGASKTKMEQKALLNLSAEHIKELSQLIKNKKKVGTLLIDNNVNLESIEHPTLCALGDCNVLHALLMYAGTLELAMKARLEDDPGLKEVINDCLAENTQFLNELLHVFIDLGVHTDESTGFNNMTPLMTASLLNLESVVPILLKNGADLNATDAHGRTPFMYSAITASEENPHLACLLKRKGANINACDLRGNNAIHVVLEDASKKNEGIIKDIIEKLINLGVNPAKENYAHRSPPDIAEQKQLQYLQKLLSSYGEKGKSTVANGYPAFDTNGILAITAGTIMGIIIATIIHIQFKRDS